MLKRVTRALRRRLSPDAVKAGALWKTHVHVGRYTYKVPDVFIYTGRYHVHIGNFCSIARGVKILVDGNHRTDWVSTFPFGHFLKGVPKNPGHPAGKGDVRIGHDVWIGADALILSGVTVGDGAVIGAGAVVTKDVGDYEIVGGNPAKRIRFRFSEPQIAALKKIRWWDWDLEKIKENVPLLESEDVDEFIGRHLK